MKRMHIHISVGNLTESIRFYSALFACDPTIIKQDYAKWMLEDPRINFAISQRGKRVGLDHLGFQVETNNELVEMNKRLKHASLPIEEQIGAACCYAKSDKYWIIDPQGIAWESFHSLDSIPTFGEQIVAEKKESTACCGPTSSNASKCC